MSFLGESGIIECPICCDLFNLCCETYCGHAFCEYCINKCLEKEPDVCPVCRKNPSPVHPRRIQKDKWTSERNRTFYPLFDCLLSQIRIKTATEHKEAGNSMYAKGDFAGAISRYGAALEVGGPNSVIYANRAACYIKLKQFRLALDDCDASIRLDKNFAKPYIRKIICYHEMNETQKAVEALKLAKSVDKDLKFASELEEWEKKLIGTSQKPSNSRRPSESSNSRRMPSPFESFFGFS